MENFIGPFHLDQAGAASSGSPTHPEIIQKYSIVQQLHQASIRSRPGSDDGFYVFVLYPKNNLLLT